jgi:thiosulfate reductase cytochrome b subunit
MGKNYYHYPVWVRLWHIINAVLCISLVVTGIIMFVYDPSAGSAESYQKSVSIHDVCGLLLTVSYFGFFFGNLFTDNGRHYRTTLRGLGKRLWRQIKYYSEGYFRGESAPFPVDGEHKFNPLQQLIYAGLMYVIMPLLFITGLILMFPSFILGIFPGFSGLEFSQTFHIVLACLIVIFLIIHLTISLTGKPPLHNLRSIITGWKESV